MLNMGSFHHVSPGKLMFFQSKHDKTLVFQMVSSTTGGIDKMWFTDVHGMNVKKGFASFPREKCSVKCSPHTSFKLGTGVNWENMVTWWKCREKHGKIT